MQILWEVVAVTVSVTFRRSVVVWSLDIFKAPHSVTAMVLVMDVSICFEFPLFGTDTTAHTPPYPKLTTFPGLIVYFKNSNIYERTINVAWNDVNGH